MLVYSAYQSVFPGRESSSAKKLDPIASRLRMDGSYPSSTGQENYNVRSVPGGFGIMFIAGTLSGLLGIGSRALKVIAMDQVMRLPFKVSTTTSNFMIGVTAAASAGVYLNRGYVDPGPSMPVMLGVLAGSFVGTHVLMASRTRLLRIVFESVIFVLAIVMIYNALKGRL